MNSFMKKLAIVTLFSLVLTPFLQVPPAYASHNLTVNVTSINQQVTRGVSPFRLTFTVSDNTAATSAASITLYIKAPLAGGNCYIPTPAAGGALVSRVAENAPYLEGGPYELTWNGTNLSGQSVADGQYCFFFRAQDSHGVTKFLFPQVTTDNNIVTLVTPSSGGTSGGNTGTGTGGAGTGGQTGGTQGVVSGPVTQSKIQHQVHPPVVDFYQSQIATIDYTVMQTFPGTWVATEVYGPDGFFVQRLFPDFRPWQGTSGTLQWNGSCSGGSSHRWCNESSNGLAEGTADGTVYTYKFFAGGVVVDEGRIAVTNVPPAPLPPPVIPLQIVNFGPQPTSFTPDLNETTRFRYQVTQNAQVSAYVYPSNFTPQNASSPLPQAPIAALRAVEFGVTRVPGSSYQSAPWDGKDANGNTVSQGTYPFVIVAASTTGSNETVYSWGVVTVNRVSPPPPPQPTDLQIVNFGPSAIPFNPDTQPNVQLKYSVNQNAAVTVRIYPSTFAPANAASADPLSAPTSTTSPVGPVRTIELGVSRSANLTNSPTWDGRDTGGNVVAAGTYPYVVIAFNGTVTRYSWSQVTVTRGTPPPPPTPTALQITNLQVSPGTFSPALSQSASISFSVNQAARVTINIQRGASLVQQLLVAPTNSTNVGAGPFTTQWNGFSSVFNRFLNTSNDNDNYTIVVDVQGAPGSGVTGTSATTFVGVSNAATPPPPPPPTTTLQLTNLGANPNTFNPDTGISTDFRYQLSHDALVTTRVYPTTFAPANISAPDPLSINPFSPTAWPLRTVETGVSRTGGNIVHSSVWNGRDDFGTTLQTGTYPFVIRAQRSVNSAEVVYSWGMVTVFRGVINPPPPPPTTGLFLNDLGPTRVTFRPDPNYNETTTLRFEINRSSPSFVVTVEGGVPSSTIRTLSATYTGSVSSGGQTWYRYETVWDGRNAVGALVATNTYTYRVKAFSGTEQMERIGFVRVERTTGVTVTSSTNCAGFSDVPVNHSLCPAIQFVVSRGIFLGDGGRNTLRIDEVLKRAESSRVMQSAFGYSLEPYSSSSDGNLGFSDLRTDQWYMPYMKTFTIRKILEGYPDGLMRPSRTMGRAEMYKVFVEGAFDAPLAVPHFITRKPVVHKPFADTPINKDTKWYLSYADFAQVNDLVTTSHFFPGKGITRGTMIKLIYDTHIKGLITYGQVNPNPGSSNVAVNY